MLAYKSRMPDVTLMKLNDHKRQNTQITNLSVAKLKESTGFGLNNNCVFELPEFKDHL